MKEEARSFKFRMKEEEGLYYPCSENKGADQLRGHREADLRLCFRIYADCLFSHAAAHIMKLPIKIFCEAKKKKRDYQFICFHHIAITTPLLSASEFLVFSYFLWLYLI